jgi:hypothetical protein
MRNVVLAIAGEVPISDNATAAKDAAANEAADVMKAATEETNEEATEDTAPVRAGLIAKCMWRPAALDE